MCSASFSEVTKCRLAALRRRPLKRKLGSDHPPPTSTGTTDFWQCWDSIMVAMGPIASVHLCMRQLYSQFFLFPSAHCVQELTLVAPELEARRVSLLLEAIEADLHALWLEGKGDQHASCQLILLGGGADEPLVCYWPARRRMTCLSLPSPLSSLMDEEASPLGFVIRDVQARIARLMVYQQKVLKGIQVTPLDLDWRLAPVTSLVDGMIWSPGFQRTTPDVVANNDMVAVLSAWMAMEHVLHVSIMHHIERCRRAEFMQFATSDMGAQLPSRMLERGRWNTGLDLTPAEWLELLDAENTRTWLCDTVLQLKSKEDAIILREMMEHLLHMQLRIYSLLTDIVEAMPQGQDDEQEAKPLACFAAINIYFHAVRNLYLHIHHTSVYRGEVAHKDGNPWMRLTWLHSSHGHGINLGICTLSAFELLKEWVFQQDHVPAIVRSVGNKLPSDFLYAPLRTLPILPVQIRTRTSTFPITAPSSDEHFTHSLALRANAMTGTFAFTTYPFGPLSSYTTILQAQLYKSLYLQAISRKGTGSRFTFLTKPGKALALEPSSPPVLLNRQTGFAIAFVKSPPPLPITSTMTLQEIIRLLLDERRSFDRCYLYQDSISIDP